MKNERLTFLSKKGTMSLELSADSVQAAIESDSTEKLKNIMELLNAFEEKYYPETP